MVGEASVATDSSVLAEWMSDIGKVLVGAAIAFGTSWWFARRAERKTNRALAFSLLFRVGDASQFIVGMRRLLTQNLHLQSKGNYPYKWMLVQVPVSFDWREHVKFPPEELALLAVSDQTALVTRLGELARLHNILLKSASQYASLREALTTKISGGERLVVVDGTEMKAAVTPETVAKLAPDIAVVEHFLDQLLALLQEGATLSRALSDEVGPALRAAIRDKSFKTVVAVSEEPHEVA